MNQFYLRLMGSFDLLDDQGRSIRLYSDKVRGLLTFLYMNRGDRVGRDTLAKLFWPRYTEDSARVNLRRALSELRKTFTNHVVIESNNRSVRWVADEQYVASDIDTLRTIRDRIERHDHGDVRQCQACQASLQEVLSLAGGGFCRSLKLEQCEAFNRWRLGRERQLIDLLESLSDQISGGLHRPYGHIDESFLGLSREFNGLQSDDQVQAFLGAMRLSLNLILVDASPEMRSQLENLTVSSVLNAQTHNTWKQPLSNTFHN